ncbi:hypothetical protein EJB05_08218, partial [Eragrostis curvula]
MDATSAEACSLPFSLSRVTSELHEQVIQEGDAQGTVQENSLGMSWMGLKDQNFSEDQDSTYYGIQFTLQIPYLDSTVLLTSDS